MSTMSLGGNGAQAQAMPICRPRSRAAVLIGAPLPSFAACLVERRGIVAADRDSWFAECLRVGDIQSSLSVSLAHKGQRNAACSAGLSALTAFRAAAHLIGSEDSRRDDVMARAQACARNLWRHVDCGVEFVALPGVDRAPLRACFWPAPDHRKPAPAVICIGDEGESLELLLGRVVPAAAEKGLAMLLIEMSELRDTPGLQYPGMITAEMRLADCIDDLVSRSVVDAERIAVRGDGLAGAVATRLAISDSRIAAAVCDGGLWDAVRSRAGVAWIAGGDAAAPGSDETARRTRLARQMRCPFLVVASAHNVSSVAEAVALRDDCARLGVRMDLDVQHEATTALGAVEDLVRGEAGIADWLALELSAAAGQVAEADLLPLAHAGREKA